MPNPPPFSSGFGTGNEGDNWINQPRIEMPGGISLVDYVLIGATDDDDDDDIISYRSRFNGIVKYRNAACLMNRNRIVSCESLKFTPLACTHPGCNITPSHQMAPCSTYNTFLVDS